MIIALAGYPAESMDFQMRKKENGYEDCEFL